MNSGNISILCLSLLIAVQSAFSNDLQIHNAGKQNYFDGFLNAESRQHYYSFCAGAGPGMVVWTGSSYQDLILGGLWGVDQNGLGTKSNLNLSLWIDGAGLKIMQSSSEKVEFSTSIHSLATWEYPRLAVGCGLSLQLNYHHATYPYQDAEKRIGLLFAPGLYGRLGSSQNNIEAGINSRRHLIPGPLSFHLNFTLSGTRFGLTTFYANMSKPEISDDWGQPGGLFLETKPLEVANYLVSPMLGLNVSGSPPGIFFSFYIQNR